MLIAFVTAAASAILISEYFLSGRSVSGSMRKLVTDGYVEKISVNPIAYGLTDLGKDYKFDN